MERWIMDMDSGIERHCVSYASRICLQHHDGRIRVWRHRVRIAGTLNSQSYMSEVLEPEVFRYIQRLPSTMFQ
ncbi:hypothetical protein TNCV_5010301 [Trichonephila clavipes]|nr:hypothetical protein TNCV_5010301 [Trichonephila clavipes]